MAETRVRDPEAGLTMIEIMISVLLVSVAAAFVFSIQMRTSTALRDQQAIAEMQQTLRSASDQMVRDLRQAGYLARRVRVANPSGTGACTPDGVNLLEVGGVSVVNSSSGPDLVRVLYANAAVKGRRISYSVNESEVDDVTGFAADQLVLMASTDPNPTTATWGRACALQLTGVVSATKMLQHNPGAGFNLAGQCQCDNVTPLTTDIVFTPVNMRAYRIKPDDIRGILQMSPSGGMTADWVDMAVGVVDLQVAMRVLDPGDATDEDGDGDAERDWFSGDNMETALAAADSRILAVSLTLVAKTSKEVNGVVLSQTPDIIAADAGVSNNRVGDRAGVTLPVTDPASMYHGEFVYRSYTSTVDIRN